MIYHSKALGKSFSKINVLLKSSDWVKSYGNLSTIFLSFNYFLPNMVMSRDADRVFWKLWSWLDFPLYFRKTCQIWCCYCLQNKSYDVLKIWWAKSDKPPPTSPMWNRVQSSELNFKLLVRRQFIKSSNRISSQEAVDQRSWKVSSLYGSWWASICPAISNYSHYNV